MQSPTSASGVHISLEKQFLMATHEDRVLHKLIAVDLEARGPIRGKLDANLACCRHNY